MDDACFHCCLILRHVKKVATDMCVSLVQPSLLLTYNACLLITAPPSLLLTKMKLLLHVSAAHSMW